MTTPKADDAMTPSRSGHVEAGGIRYYYEIHGEGEPLLLLHGGLGSIDMFGPVCRRSPRSRRSSASTCRATAARRSASGRSSLMAMGDDMAAIVKELGYEQVDVLGYSMGGGVALPARACSIPKRCAGWRSSRPASRTTASIPRCSPQQAQVGAAMAEMMKDTPMYKSYVAGRAEAGGFSAAARCAWASSCARRTTGPRT